MIANPNGNTFDDFLSCMRTSARWCCLRGRWVLFAALAFVAPYFVQAIEPVSAVNADVEFVLDLSGSMRQKLGNETQIESARKALEQALAELPPQQLVAVRTYGHRVDQTDKNASCKDTELIVPFKPVDVKEIVAKVGGLTPKGYTPIAYSLQETRNDLYDVGIAREAERVIILLSDGEETCGGDPVQVLRQLEKEGFKVKVFTVGFNVNDVARKQLEAIAAESGGKYFDAKDAGQLNASLKEAAKASIVTIDKEKKQYGDKIRGGNSYEDAVALPLNVELRLDHHQKKEDLDYFYLEAPAGAEIAVTFSTLDRGIERRSDGSIIENQYPYHGVQIHDSKRTKLKAGDILAEKFKSSEIRATAQAEGRYYVLVGSGYSDINGDYSTFKVSVERKGDLAGEADAGADLAQALPIRPQRYEPNYIGDSDDIDMFALEAKAGDSLTLGVVPIGKSNSYFTLRVIDEFKQQLASESSSSGAGVKTKQPVVIPEDGTYYLEVGYQGDDHVSYALVVKKKESLEGGAKPEGAEGEAPAQ